MNLDFNSEAYRSGVAAVQAAARLCESVRRKLVEGGSSGRIDKVDRSPVTVADFGGQALVCRTIDRAFPGDTIVAEEDSVVLRRAENSARLQAVVTYVSEQVGEVDASTVCRWIDRGGGDPNERFWVLDPIDGTKGFLRNDQYAIALALIEEGEVRWSFLACPVLSHGSHPGVLFVAQQGRGSIALSLDGSLIGAVRVSDTGNAQESCLVESVEAAHTNRGLAGSLKEALQITTPSVRMDSQAKYAAVARGEAEIYLRSPNPRTPDYRENIWDHAAGWLVVEEAGGRVTDIYGKPLDWSEGRRLEENIGVVATNGVLHDAVIDALGPFLAQDNWG